MEEEYSTDPRDYKCKYCERKKHVQDMKKAGITDRTISKLYYQHQDYADSLLVTSAYLREFIFLLKRTWSELIQDTFSKLTEIHSSMSSLCSDYPVMIRTNPELTLTTGYVQGILSRTATTFSLYHKLVTGLIVIVKKAMTLTSRVFKLHISFRDKADHYAMAYMLKRSRNVYLKEVIDLIIKNSTAPQEIYYSFLDLSASLKIRFPAPVLDTSFLSYIDETADIITV